MPSNKARSRSATPRRTITSARTSRSGFGTALPFGLTTRQQNAWMYHGGGIEIMNEFLQGIRRRRIPGRQHRRADGRLVSQSRSTSLRTSRASRCAFPALAAQVMARIGAVPQALPGGDIYPALERGAIDATEWVGPYDDEKLGFYKIAKNYYYPGWWEPCSMYHVMINLEKWDAPAEALSGGHDQRGARSQPRNGRGIRCQEPLSAACG